MDPNEDANLTDQIVNILGVPEVACAIDCVGFEASGHGNQAKIEVSATVLNSLREIARAGGSIGISGLYVTAASAWAGPKATPSTPAKRP